MKNKLFGTLLALTGMAGATAFSMSLFTPPSSLAESEPEISSVSMKVSPTTVDVRKLPRLSPGQRAAARKETPAPRIPGGEALLNRIKLNPMSISAGRVAANAFAAAKITAPPQAISKKNVGTLATTGLNCPGNAATGFGPSDSHGAVGKNHYVSVTNVDIGIYSKTACATTSFVSLKSFFGITDPGVTAFDPRATYDFVNDRYVVTAETRTTTAPTTDQFQFFAVSATGDPTGAWFVYPIALSQGSSFFCKKALTDFWDYPNLGYSKSRWFLTANNFPTAGGAYGAIMTIDKAATLVGSAAALRCYGTGSQGVQFNTAPPLIKANTNVAAYFLSPGSGGGNSLKRYKLKTNDVMNFSGSIPIPAWTAPPNAPQPGTANLIDTIDGRIQSNTVQFGSILYATHAINGSAGTAAVRVYKIDAVAQTATVPVNLDFGTGLAAWGPSIATKAGGNNNPFFLTHSYSGTGQLPSTVMYTGKNSGAGLAGFIYATGPAITTPCSRCRWGDYSATNLDPNNLNSGFGTAQYLRAGGTSFFDWKTQIMQLSNP